ncbi:MAG: glutamate 5-kinase [Puniceicoccaceae bacterium]|nr:MAG: glutamate 5-kinase [Puniceicoccaceae bacterium]
MPPLPSPPRRLVIKLGTGILTSGPDQINTDRVEAVCTQIRDLRARGIACLVVSSGAVGLGMGRLGLKRRPTELHKLQACAAIGQGRLIQLWQRALEPHQLTAAQILLTHDDLRLRGRYLAVKGTLEHLLKLGVVPVINENDSVSSEEIRFGDNDILSAMVASVIGADHLIILSTAPGLIDFDNGGGIIPVVEAITPEVARLARGTESPTAVGGMISKIDAARLAGKAGCGVFIADGAVPGIIPELLAGKARGTFFVPSGLPMVSRKRWLAYFQRPAGSIIVDGGAREAVQHRGRSLLASGVVGSTGHFAPGEIVNLQDEQGRLFARGEARFSSNEITAIARKSSRDLKALFPDRRRLEVVHRNALVLLDIGA